MTTQLHPGSTRGLRRSAPALHSVNDVRKRTQPKWVPMDALQILLIAALVIFLIGRRFAGQPVGARSLLVPLILTGMGVKQLAGHHGIGTGAVTLLGIEVLIAIAAGAARAATIKLYLRDGHLWQRYTPVTLAVWIAMIAI